MTDPYTSATLHPNTPNLNVPELTEDQVVDAFADYVIKKSTFKKPKDSKKDIKILKFTQKCYLKYTLSSYVETRYIDERKEDIFETPTPQPQVITIESRNDDWESENQEEGADSGTGLSEGQTINPFTGKPEIVREGDSMGGGAVAAHYQMIGSGRREGSDENATYRPENEHHMFDEVSPSYYDEPAPKKEHQRAAPSFHNTPQPASAITYNPVLKDLWQYNLQPANEWWKGTREILLEKRREQNEDNVTMVSKFVIADYKTKTDIHFAGSKETPISDSKIENITGLQVHDWTSQFPIGQIPLFPDFPSFNDAVSKILKDHYNKYQMKNKESKRVRVQHHSVMSIPVTSVDMKYKGKQMKAWVYGYEKNVQCPDMKGCCVM